MTKDDREGGGVIAASIMIKDDREGGGGVIAASIMTKDDREGGGSYCCEYND